MFLKTYFEFVLNNIFTQVFINSCTNTAVIQIMIYTVLYFIFHFTLGSVLRKNTKRNKSIYFYKIVTWRHGVKNTKRIKSIMNCVVKKFPITSFWMQLLRTEKKYFSGLLKEKRVFTNEILFITSKAFFNTNENVNWKP